MSLTVPLHRPEPIGAHHQVAAFDCAGPALNEFLIRHALTNHQSGSAKTFVATTNDHVVVGYYSLFAGIRRSELVALDWPEVNLAQGMIEVRGTKAKTRQRRIVHVCASLREWLAPYAQQTGGITVSKAR